MKGTMEEFEMGTLRSRSKTGPVVKNRKQAIAIGLSEERRAGKTPSGQRPAHLQHMKKHGL
jgi:hypothetical protein